MGRAQFDHASFLQAARARITERGPQAVTVDSVAERMGAPKGSFYYRFASRDALLGDGIDGHCLRPALGDKRARRPKEARMIELRPSHDCRLSRLDVLV